MSTATLMALMAIRPFHALNKVILSYAQPPDKRKAPAIPQNPGSSAALVPPAQRFKQLLIPYSRRISYTGTIDEQQMHPQEVYTA
nr:hypothetical protein [uncultured Acetatifactor sp.]